MMSANAPPKRINVSLQPKAAISIVMAAPSTMEPAPNPMSNTPLQNPGLSGNHLMELASTAL
ncbi:hypothetical protein SDC9_165645 [bioreactor metagenome]|uniref:Uncharacterized protein n=1 Tax=bioreactor metagenome TaxID=1076179 RepID=A0A645FUY6_9ZZZZ